VAECIGAGNYLVDHDKMSLTMKMNRLLKQLELNENVTRNSIHISLNFDPSETNYRLIGAFAPFLLVFNQLIKNCYKVMCYTPISDKVICTSRDKGASRFDGTPFGCMSFRFQRDDIHPVDLISDSSMSGLPKF
jgi:hypothetical protein